MNTPITDAARESMESIRPDGAYRIDHFAKTARRLELDRAALMEALEGFIEEQCEARPTEYSFALGAARAALTAARANFPES